VAELRKASQDVEAALQAAQDEREVYRKAGDGKGEAITLLVVTSLRVEKKDYQAAAASANQARGLFREAGNLLGQATALQMLAEMNMAQGAHEVALRSANEALPLLRESGDRKGEAAMMFLSTQASALRLLGGKLDPSSFAFKDGAHKAAQSAREAISAARKAGESDVAASAQCLLAQLHLASMKGQEAVEAASAAVAIFRGSGDVQGQGYALLMSAGGLLTSGKPGRAREAASKALLLFREAECAEGEQMAQHIIDIIENPPQPDEEDLAGYGEAPEALQRSSQAAVADTSATTAALRDTIRETVNEIVGMDDLQDDSPLMNMGLTSQSAVLLRNALTKELPGPSLPFTMMFDYPSIKHLTEFFVKRGQN